jgi:hypothetical protein
MKKTLHEKIIEDAQIDTLERVRSGEKLDSIHRAVLSGIMKGQPPLSERVAALLKEIQNERKSG